MIRAHHLAVSQSIRVMWLLEELGIPYDAVLHQRDPVTRTSPPALKAVHALGSAPVIEDGDLILAESGAIVEYLIARHGNGRLAVAPDAPAYPDYIYWMHFANGTLLPSHLIAGLLSQGEGHPLAPAFEGRKRRSFQLIEDRLGQVPYLAGDAFTAADIMVHYSFGTGLAHRQDDLSPYANILAWKDRLEQRPAYQRAMQLG